MCRIAAYLGPPIRLSELLLEPSHSLLRQSYAPREMTDGTLNADGWGVGWFPPGSESAPGVLKGTQPIWSDENAHSATRAIASDLVVAVVRGATPGIGVAQSNTPPYVFDDALLAHNGRCWPWSGPLVRTLRQQLGADEEGSLRGTTDSEFLGGLWRAMLRRELVGDPAGALRKVLKIASDLAHDHDGGLSANVIVAQRGEIVASRFASRGRAPTLHVRSETLGDVVGTWVASEPLDESPAWRCVPPSSIVRVDAHGVRVEPLD